MLMRHALLGRALGLSLNSTLSRGTQQTSARTPLPMHHIYRVGAWSDAGGWALSEMFYSFGLVRAARTTSQQRHCAFISIHPRLDFLANPKPNMLATLPNCWAQSPSASEICLLVATPMHVIRSTRNLRVRICRATSCGNRLVHPILRCDPLANACEAIPTSTLFQRSTQIQDGGLFDILLRIPAQLTLHRKARRGRTIWAFADTLSACDYVKTVLRSSGRCRGVPPSLATRPAVRTHWVIPHVLHNDVFVAQGHLADPLQPPPSMPGL